MAKAPLDASSLAPLLRDYAKTRGWSLCVGAGTSDPMFPMWSALVSELIRPTVPPATADHILKDLLSKVGLDGLIRAAQEQLGQDDAAFAATLSQALYSRARSKVSSDVWDTIASALSARHPGDLSPATWRGFLEHVREYFPEVSSRGIAKVVAASLGSEMQPVSILSFNAEPLLYALINAEVATTRQPSPGITTRGETVAAKPLDLVAGSTSFHSPHRPGYFFCHGLLEVPRRKAAVARAKREHALAAARLVFSESQYLQIASTTFSWQSATFTQAAMNRPIVFIGVSLTDPNIRRWLSWIHDTRQAEIKIMSGAPAVSTLHFWLNRHPGNEDVARWIEASVAHLGVRVIWMKSWNLAGETLARLLGIDVKP